MSEALTIPYDPDRLARLLGAAARIFGADLPTLRGAGRQSADGHSARLACCWVARHQFGLTLTQIGQWLRRDHSTIVHALRQVERRRAKDEAFAEALARLDAEMHPEPVRMMTTLTELRAEIERLGSVLEEGAALARRIVALPLPRALTESSEEPA